IAPARTFILYDEIQSLQAAGLGRGATYQNTLVYREGTVIENELRFADEFARHKVLDLIGDISLAGRPIAGRIVACRSGHRLNVEFARRIASLLPESPTPWPVERIMGILPHRYPFLLIDRIVEVVPERRAVGVKNVTMNEGFFQGHFPGRPVMPGVLQIEAMAQLAGVLLLSDVSRANHIAYLMSLDRVKFRRPVVPGDRLMLRVEVTKLRARNGEVFTEALVDGQVVAEAEIRFMLIPR
ncbi:MAG: 3-hydroxyacyl-ACP dehydratase FabZ, partial [Planctomycetes bacterium]|nr:3-hydroxyacyl-ACP dehydratase FabZ [Planctomycetota bacterium]